MEKIEPGKYVELGYDLYQVNEDGSETLVHQTSPEDPERIIFGVTRGVIEPLEHAVAGLEVGGKFDVKVEAAKAFGPYDPEQVATLPKEVFEVDGKFDSEAVRPGAHLPMMTADGFRITGFVKEVTDNEVKMDFNHPLAGKDVRFSGSILAVRNATEDEIKMQQGGCGCGCGDCGDDCGCSSQGGCGDSACHCG